MTKTLSFLEDDEVRNFIDLESFNSFADDRKVNDRWIETRVSDTQVVGIENGPIVADQIKARLYNYKGTDDTFSKTMATHGMLVLVKDPWETATYDIREIGLSSLYQRAGLLGRTIRDTDNALGSILRSTWLTKSMSLYQEPAKVLVRDGKVSCMLSSRYYVMHSADLIRELNRYFNEEWDGWRFNSGTASHEIIDATYTLDPCNEAAKDVLEQAGFTCRFVGISARFVTSDVGDNAATLYPTLDVDGLPIMLGEAIKVAHTDKDGLETWKADIKRFGSLLKKGEESIKELADKKIRNSGGCLRYMACELKLPKDMSLAVGAELDAMYISGCSALDVYYYLHEIVDRYASDKQLTPTQKLNYQESVARAIGMDFKDVPFEWE